MSNADDARRHACSRLQDARRPALPSTTSAPATPRSSYLHRFPIDILKIDRSFVAQIDRHGDSAAVIGAVIALAHNLRMDVVAEGIETPEQVALLRALDCDFGQGYFFAKPLPAPAASAFLSPAPAPLRQSAA